MQHLLTVLCVSIVDVCIIALLHPDVQDLAATRSEIRDKSEAVKEKHEFLDQEKQNNEEVTKKVNMAERQSAKMRLDCQAAETGRMQFKDEVCLTVGG